MSAESMTWFHGFSHCHYSYDENALQTWMDLLIDSCLKHIDHLVKLALKKIPQAHARTLAYVRTDAYQS